MSDNYYQPPSARVDDGPVTVAQSFYVVAPRKFILLFLFTLGLYAVYWFYRNWAQLKQRRQLNIWPVPRAIFAIFFTHSLFREVESALTSAGQRFAWNAQTTATVYVVLSLLSSGLDRLAAKEIGSPLTDFAAALLLPALMFPLLSAQKAINLADGDPEGAGNSSLTAANIVWLVVGGLLWLLLLLGLYVTVIGEEALQ